MPSDRHPTTASRDMLMGRRSDNAVAELYSDKSHWTGPLPMSHDQDELLKLQTRYTAGVSWQHASDSKLMNVWMCPIDGSLVDQQALGTHAAWHSRIGEIDTMLTALKSSVETLHAEVTRLKGLIDVALDGARTHAQSKIDHIQSDIDRIYKTLDRHFENSHGDPNV